MSLLDFYPSGAYKLTKDGNQKISKFYDNLSQIGAGNKRLNLLFRNGYIDNSKAVIGIEKFTNMENKNISYILLLVIFILILIFIS